ncbi:hypothetical protein ACFL41_01810 [Gemmatimonadota bacterium]
MKLTVTIQLLSETTVRPGEESIAVVLLNTGDEPVKISSQLILSPSLALEVRTAGGDTVRFPPPPLPDPNAAVITIEPGREYSSKMKGFLPQTLSSGYYQIRMRIQYMEELVSNWIELQIVD